MPSRHNEGFPTGSIDLLAELTEQPPADFREVAIRRDGRGDYYASFVYQVKEEERHASQTVAFDLGIKTLATGVNEHGRFYHIGGFKGGQWYNRQLDTIRSKRDKCQKKSRRYIHLSKVYKRVAQKKRNKQRDSLKTASHLIAQKLVERTVMIGDLSQRQMAMKEHRERKKHLNRVVFNDWGLSTFTQMLTYKCQLYGKELVLENERNTSKACSSCGNLQAMPLWKRAYCCTNCGLVMDRDDNSAVNILTRFLARRGPYTSFRACDVL